MTPPLPRSSPCDHDKTTGPPIMIRLTCYACGKPVSSDVHPDIIVRAAMVCPECIASGAVTFPRKPNRDQLIELLRGVDGIIATAFDDCPPETDVETFVRFKVRERTGDL